MKNREKATQGDIRLSNIVPAKGNVRKRPDQGKLKELADSIKAHGVIEPIVVRREAGEGETPTYEVVCGTRRFEASKLAGKESIPAVIMDLTDEQVHEMQLIENLQREDMNPIDEAMGFCKIQDQAHFTVERLADKIGKSADYVSGRLQLLNLSKTIQGAIANGTITTGHGAVILRLEPGMREKLYGRIVNEKLSVRAAENELAAYGMELKDAPFDRKACVACDFNGNRQAGLFDADTDLKGRCLNAGCFKKKADQFVKAKAEELRKAGRKVITYEQWRKDPKHYQHRQLGKDDYDRRELGKKFEEKCRECPSLVFVVETGGNERIPRIVECCPDNTCFRRLTSSNRPKAADNEDFKKEHDKRKADELVLEAKRRFWKKNIITGSSPEDKGRIMAHLLIQYVSRYASIPEGQDKLIERLEALEYEHDGKIAKEFLALTPKEVATVIVHLFDIAINRSLDLEDEDLAYMSSYLKKSIDKDWIIDEDYLQPKTKDQLVKLARELKLYSGALKLEDKKKSELIKWILGNDLKGKIPKEMAK